MIEVALRTTLPGFTLDVAWEAGDEVVTLFGPSGAGKSLTLQCLAGLTRPDAGRVVVNGRVFDDTATGIHLPPQARHLGYVFQGYALFPHLTVAENVAFGLRSRPRPERAAAHGGGPRPDGPRGAGRALPRRALGGPAAAGGARPRHRPGPGRAAPRRAALRPRRAAPPAAPRGAARAGRRAPADRRARHPRSRRSLPARRSPDPLRGRAGRPGRARRPRCWAARPPRRWRGSSGSATSCAAPSSRPRRIASRSPGAGTRSKRSTRRRPRSSAAPGRRSRSSCGPSTCGSSGRIGARPDPGHHMNLLQGTIVEAIDHGRSWTLLFRLAAPGPPSQGAYDLEIEMPAPRLRDPGHRPRSGVAGLDAPRRAPGAGAPSERRPRPALAAAVLAIEDVEVRYDGQVVLDVPALDGPARRGAGRDRPERRREVHAPPRARAPDAPDPGHGAPPRRRADVRGRAARLAAPHGLRLPGAAPLPGLGALQRAPRLPAARRRARRGRPPRAGLARAPRDRRAGRPAGGPAVGRRGPADEPRPRLRRHAGGPVPRRALRRAGRADARGAARRPRAAARARPRPRPSWSPTTGPRRSGSATAWPSSWRGGSRRWARPGRSSARRPARRSPGSSASRTSCRAASSP